MRFLLLALISLPLCAQDCAPPASLSPNDSKAGILDQTSCQMAGATPYNEYLVVFPVRGTAKFTTKGFSGFLPSLILRNGLGNLVASGIVISQYVESGVYHLLVNGGAPGGTGEFTLSAVFQPEPNILCTVFRNLGAGQSIAGQLTATSCRLPDNSLFDGWQITVYGAGTLTVAMNSGEFATNLILRGPDGVAIASDSTGGGGTNSLISVDLPGNETYTLVAAASDPTQKGGDYGLVTTFSPDDGETCVPSGSLSPASLVSGNVSESSCNFDLPGREDSSLFNFYSIHVDSAGLSQISVASSSFSPLLLLLDANDNEVTEDSESGGDGAPVIQRQLTPGDYRLLIFDEDSYDGEYTIQYNLTPGAPAACAGQTLIQNVPVSGTLNAASSCRVEGSLSDIYRIVLPSAGTLDIDMSSGDFSTLMVLHDSTDDLIDYGLQTSTGESSDVLLQLPAGTYFVSASSGDLPGSYQLSYQFTPVPQPVCPSPQAISVNTAVAGSLSSASCTGSDGQPFDSYQITTPTDGAMAVVVTSDDIPSLLTLTDLQGDELRTDAGSYTAGDSIIVQYLKAGTYQVQVRSDEYNLTGAYRLNALFTASATKPSYCAAAALKIGTQQEGAISYTDCPYNDGTFADFYSVAIKDPLNLLTIHANSTSFPPALIVLDGRGNVVATDLNPTAGADSIVSGLFSAGTYYVAAKPAAGTLSSGPYIISVNQ